MIILGEPENTVVRKAFNVDIKDGTADLGSRMSRKKDIVPPLELYFNTNY
jgi:manganese-dependent inorganic pyrophosphatase